MSEHVGRIALVRRKRLRPPSPWEKLLLLAFVLGVFCVPLGVGTALAPGVSSAGRVLAVLTLLANVLTVRYGTGPLARRILRRWWWGE